MRISAWIAAICLLTGLVVYFGQRTAVSEEQHEIPNERAIDTTTIVVPVAKTQEEIHSDAQEMAAVLDKRIQPSFDVLLAGLDRLSILKSDESLSGQQLLDSIRRHGDLADEYISEAFEILNETYPDLTDREAWRIMAYSKAYTEYTRRATPELKEFGQEIERRFAREGKEINR